MEKFQIIRRNKQAYMISRVPWLAFTLTAVIQMWQRDGMDYADMLVLQGLFALALILLEVPTGILADLRNRRFIIIQGHIALTAGVLTYAYAQGFKQFLFAELLFAYGMAAISGSDTATIWDTYKLDDDEASASKALADGKILMMAGSAILLGLGGYIASLSLILPFYIATLGYLLNIVLYMKSVEPDRPKLTQMKTAWRGTALLIKNSNFHEVLIYFAINVVILRILFWSYIPKLQVYGVNRAYYGLVLALANIIAVLASFYAKKHHNSTYKITVGSFVFTGMGIVLFINDRLIIILVLAIIAQQIARAFTNVMVPIKLNQNLDSELRASAGSLISMLGGLMYFMASIVFEILNLTMREIMMATFVIYVGFLAYLFLVLIRRRGNSQILSNIPVVM